MPLQGMDKEGGSGMHLGGWRSRTERRVIGKENGVIGKENGVIGKENGVIVGVEGPGITTR